MGNVRFWNEKVLFNSNKVAMHDDCCCPPMPEWCKDNPDDCEEGTCCRDDCDWVPSFLKVVISGVVDCSCAGYVNPNGTHIVPYKGGCFWQETDTICLSVVTLAAIIRDVMVVRLACL